MYYTSFTYLDFISCTYLDFISCTYLETLCCTLMYPVSTLLIQKYKTNKSKTKLKQEHNNNSMTQHPSPKQTLPCTFYYSMHHIHLIFPAGLRLLGAFTDLNEAGSLTYGNDLIDIYSNSWGPCDEGCVDGPMRLTQMAFRIGAERVRICIACM